MVAGVLAPPWTWTTAAGPPWCLPQFALWRWIVAPWGPQFIAAGPQFAWSLRFLPAERSLFEAHENSSRGENQHSDASANRGLQEALLRHLVGRDLLRRPGLHCSPRGKVKERLCHYLCQWRLLVSLLNARWMSRADSLHPGGASWFGQVLKTPLIEADAASPRPVLLETFSPLALEASSDYGTFGPAPFSLT